MANPEPNSIPIPPHIQQRIDARKSNQSVMLSGNGINKLPSSIQLATAGGGLSQHLNDYNNRFFVMLVGGTPLVFDETSKNVVEQSMTFTNFRQMYQNDKIGSDCVPAEWLKYPLRRTLSGEIIHAPDKLHGISGNDFNTYTGPVINPAPGDSSIISDHICQCLCGGDRVQFDYYIGLLAHMFQKPYERPGVAIIHQSIEGTGKSIITRLLCNIWGAKHSITLDKQSQLTSDFNAHLCGAMFICIEETSTARNIAAGEQLKNLVTAETLTINPKGKPVFQVAHYGRVIMNTNHEWAVTAGGDSRRWFIPDISDHRVGDRLYFNKLADAVNDVSTQQAFLDYLLKIKLDKFDPSDIPATRALSHQRSQTLSRLDAPLDWLKTMLTNGFIEYEYGPPTDWESNSFEVARHKLRESYNDFSKRRRGAPTFDAAMRSLKSVIGISDGPQRRGDNQRYRTYMLPSLGTAIVEFESSTKIKI